MDGSSAPRSLKKPRAAWLTFGLALLLLAPSTGCLHLLLASGIYMIQGGNLVPAECEDLEDKRVVVFCRPPASQEFRHAGASRQLSSKVSDLLEMNVPGIDIVPQKQVDQWIDENDSDDFEELGRAVKADLVVRVELSHFDLYKGKTVYQGNADVVVKVHDMQDKARLVWEKEIGEVLFPIHSGIAVQEKREGQFQREFIAVVSEKISKNFYKHDPNADFAIDALATR